MSTLVCYVMFSNSVPDLPTDFEDGCDAERNALTSPNGDGVYVFCGDKIFELICNSDECEWIVKIQRLSLVREMPVVMYIDPDLANCS